MKGRKWLLLFVVLLVSMGAAAWYLFIDIFPKAPPIRMPKIEEITSIFVAVNNDEAFEINDLNLEELFYYIQKAEPTREQSLNDYPSGYGFFRIEVQTREREYRYFVYERGEQVYIEIPYEGIYTADSWLFSFVIKYFEE